MNLFDARIYLILGSLRNAYTGSRAKKQYYCVQYRYLKYHNAVARRVLQSDKIGEPPKHLLQKANQPRH